MQDKPRLSVRLAVALIAFIIGITSTLLFNYFWPSARAPQPEVRHVIVTTRLIAEPQTLAPCAGHDFNRTGTFVWTPAELPAPPEPPAPPQPPARPHLRRSSN
ncbi:MAG: hypothetical protein DMF64_09245 [Acidobacteria bacterium]|nr:MAG: hypothetical protein DMF64_09245 [Acidobacteriota bacterium]